MTRHVAVIGAGIVGACASLALLADGHRVTIIEPGPPGGPQAASYGNGAWISPGSVVPMATPGVWKKIPGYLLDPLGPLTIRWTSLPGLLPWLARFLMAAGQVEAISRALAALLRDAPARHAALAEAAGVGDMIQRTGLINVFPDLAAYEAEALSWRLRRQAGVSCLELGEDDLRQRVPELDRRYTFGVLIEDGAHCRDPGGYVAALVAHAQALGAELVVARATGFDLLEGRLRAVRTDSGAFACDAAVIAAGAHARALAGSAGDRVSLASERGYHVVVRDPEAAPRIPLMPSDGKMANTRVAAGLRAAGQVELAAIGAAPDWRRADVLLAHLLRTYPDLPRPLPPERVSRWMGHRPSTPDGLPVIGLAAASPDIVHAYGHGHVGLAAGPVTGSLVADLLSGRTPGIDLSPYAPSRFR